MFGVSPALLRARYTWKDLKTAREKSVSSNSSVGSQYAHWYDTVLTGTQPVKFGRGGSG